MKKLIFSLSLILLLLWACNDETRTNDPISGPSFHRANPWKFYFTDGAGNGLIRLLPGDTLPTVFEKDLSLFAIVPENRDTISYLYYYNRNTIGFDNEVNLYAWNTTIPGNEGVSHKTFYIAFNKTDIDTIRVEFKFITEGVIGGNIYANITKIYYNNVLVIKDDNYVRGNGIFIQKQDGQTTVSLK